MDLPGKQMEWEDKVELEVTGDHSRKGHPDSNNVTRSSEKAHSLDDTANGFEANGVKRKSNSPSSRTKPSGLYYDVQDNPPVHLAMLFGFQIAVANIFSSVNMAVLISQFICADQEFAASLYTTTSVMSGICTIMQTSFGVRLPVFQGPSILFLLPYLTAASDPAWGCTSSLPTDFNSSSLTNVTEELVREQPWLQQWNKIQGSLMAASALQILIGSLGLGGVLLRLMGPISITCLILLLGIQAQTLISAVCEVHWGMSSLNVILIVVLSMYVNKIKIPVPTWSRQKGMRFEPFPLFELFPILISVIIGWIISYICTVCGVFPDDPDILQYQARTDYATDSIRDASYFTVPYPGQYGAPSFKVSYAVMMAIAVMGSILESVGDYVQTTGPSRVAVPPPHAINRGIIMEGLGSFLSGAMGAGHATTSFSNIIGMIGITKVASRRVFNIAGLFMVLMGICGKLGAVFVAIPKPVLGGPIFISIALLVGAALSNLRNVDMFATRSQGVLGVAIMAGIVFPTWLSKHPGAIDTGIEEVDQSINAVVGTPLIVGVLVAMFLDMTVPGNSRLKQPTLKVNIDMKEEPAEQTAVYRVPTDTSIYDLPFLSKWLSKSKVARYIPFLPSPSQSEHRLLETTSDDLSSAPSSPTVVP